MQVMRTVLDMAMESGPARLAMIVAAIAFTQVRIVILFLVFVLFGLMLFWFHPLGKFLFPT